MSRITLVKKIRADGSTCRKCAEVVQRLEREGYLENIDRVVVADERDAASEGWALAARHGVPGAPFFIVEEHGDERVYTVYFRFVREVLKGRISDRDELREMMESAPELDFI